MMGMFSRPIVSGLLAVLFLLALYFGLLTLVSGWNFTIGQFSRFWYFIGSLALGFGIQIGLYTYLKKMLKNQNRSGGVVAVSGTTSTIAMISCCSHYLVNLLPIIGTIGIITLISQYQIELFWVGIAANLLGISYLSRKIFKLKNQ